MAAEPIIVAERIGKNYHVGASDVEAVRDFSLTVARGEFVSLMGPSGCGKSTLLNLFGCIDTPTSGRLRVFGTDAAAMSDGERSALRLRRIGFVFQRFYLLPMLTAFENVELPMIEAKVPRRERTERARSLLERVGLGHRIKHRPHQLSGGEMQRTAIARALANQPNLVIADEPTGELDRKTGASILALIKELQQGGLTVVMATHDPHAAELGDRAIQMETS
ncbi:MAG: ABC transporter ATP-binding protein [Candidatus Krumholzibacteria bacterium]|nr:ABC transporter ATP-binding protein [Candidatus Krumholzibacteria bacterium]MDH4336994.1 ABC transporter ATP-binding protein [Candidatus Krumholzibacteria bacterium]MDH5270691.1 ABC transporter ATP-binding protein [Candidatus Krumholzibacteria bacterium]MDH5627634.1 ABC transporter ATP-binding protein [Candidatus Krumholzibacteria bacterium]